MFTQLSPRACWLTPVGTLLCFWLGSCALLTEFFAFLQKRTEEVEITFELLNCCISLFLSSTVTFWGYLKPRLLSYIPVFSDRGPLPQTVSWRRGASLCLRKNNLGLSVCKKGCKFKAFVKTIWWFYWSMWAEHMEALRKKKSALFSSLGLMRRCVTNSYSSRHVVWDTLAHFTDEFVKSSRGHHLLPVYSINWVVWETLQVCLWEEGN